MITVSLRLPNELDTRLEHLSVETDRNKSYLIRRAIEDFLEDQEDFILASARLAKKEKVYTLKEVKKKLGLGS